MACDCGGEYIVKPVFLHHTFLSPHHTVLFTRIAHHVRCEECDHDLGITPHGEEAYMMVTLEDGSHIKAKVGEYHDAGKLLELWPETFSTGQCVDGRIAPGLS